MTVDVLPIEKLLGRLTEETIDAALNSIKCKDAATRDEVRGFMLHWVKMLPEALYDWLGPLNKAQMKECVAAGWWAKGYSNVIARHDDLTHRRLVVSLAFAFSDGTHPIAYGEVERRLQESLIVLDAVAEIGSAYEGMDEDSDAAPGDISMIIMEELASFFCDATGKKEMPGRNNSAITNRPNGQFYRFVAPFLPAIFGDTISIQNTIRRWVKWRNEQWEREMAEEAWEREMAEKAVGAANFTMLT
jgi:hypothetical protein